MAKPGLGKGLNQLMKGQSAVRKRTSPEIAAEKVTRVDFGRGLNTLVSAGVTEPAHSTKDRVLLPTWFFFLADLLLLAFTVAICFDAGGPLQPGEIVFALAATSLGALLAIAGVFKAQRRSSIRSAKVASEHAD